MSEGFKQYSEREKVVVNEVTAREVFNAAFADNSENMSQRECNEIEGIIAETGTSAIAKHHAFVRIAKESGSTEAVKNFVNTYSQELLKIDPGLSESNFRHQFNKLV